MARPSKSDAVTPIGRAYGLWRRAVALFPGGAFVLRQIDTAESMVLDELRSRLARPAEAFGEGGPVASGTNGAAPSPAEALASLLDRSIDQSPEDARRESFVAILNRLVPDEARILAALSDGSTFALIHVSAGPALGPSTRRLIGNVCAVGKVAGVQWTEMTPRYVAHLRELGLVEVGPEDPALALRYEILESDSEVRRVIGQVEASGRLLRPRILRRTLCLSSLGRELWKACLG